MDRGPDSDQLPELGVRLVLLGLLSPGAIAGETTTAVASPKADRRALEKVFDYLLALSVLSWGLLGAASDVNLTPVRAAVTLLHFTVAFAIFRRAPRERLGSSRTMLSALPALVLAGVAFRLAAPLETWPVLLDVAFAAGAALTLSTFVAMGESFSVLPAERTIVTRGPYRFVRHPAYAGELVMIVACVLSSPSIASAAILAATLPCIALRILAEERLLGATASYQRYCVTVPTRLIPCLW